MFDALGAFCGTDCSAGCDTGSIRNRRPTEFGEESEEELSYALFECADNDGDVADAHAALARPFRELGAQLEVLRGSAPQNPASLRKSSMASACKRGENCLPKQTTRTKTRNKPKEN